MQTDRFKTRIGRLQMKNVQSTYPMFCQHSPYNRDVSYKRRNPHDLIFEPPHSVLNTIHNLAILYFFLASFAYPQVILIWFCYQYIL